MAAEISRAMTLSVCSEGCSSSYLCRTSARVTLFPQADITHHMKLSLAVPSATLHVTGAAVLSFSWYTHELMQPVTLYGTEPLR